MAGGWYGHRIKVGRVDAGALEESLDIHGGSSGALGIAVCWCDHRIEHVNDPGLPRLAMLRFLERVQERDLARTRRWIADEERREAERQRGIQARPLAPA